MGQFQALYSQLTRQTPGIVNLYSIVINGNARKEIVSLILTMAESICQSLAQCLCRYLQMLLSHQTNNLSAQRQVLEQKCHTCIQKLKEKSDVGSPEELSFWLEASI